MCVCDHDRLPIALAKIVGSRLRSRKRSLVARPVRAMDHLRPCSSSFASLSILRSWETKYGKIIMDVVQDWRALLAARRNRDGQTVCWEGVLYEELGSNQCHMLAGYISELEHLSSRRARAQSVVQWGRSRAAARLIQTLSCSTTEAVTVNTLLAEQALSLSQVGVASCAQRHRATNSTCRGKSCSPGSDPTLLTLSL